MAPHADQGVVAADPRRGLKEPVGVAVAARNNAEWCDAFCRTHGLSGEFRADAWSSAVRTPPYYPDAVTLAPEVAVESLLERVDAADGCSIKDSFASLDLHGAGFRRLFRAEWVVLALPGASRRGWSAVANGVELRAWEEACGDAPSEGGFFRRALLHEESVAVLACRDGERVVAGAIANRSTTVIGLSNVFDRGGDLASAWAAGAAAAAELWGAQPVVGYDSGAALAAARDAGFTSIGELVVWLKPP